MDRQDSRVMCRCDQPELEPILPALSFKVNAMRCYLYTFHSAVLSPVYSRISLQSPIQGDKTISQQQTGSTYIWKLLIFHCLSGINMLYVSVEEGGK